MDATFLSTTRNAEYVALGTGGQRVIRCWDQISSYLERSLSEAHARLFAEPQHDAAAGTTDWYAAGSGEALRLADLSPEEAALARERLAALAGDIKGAVERLKQSRREEERVLSELLEMALVIPAEDALWVLRGAGGAEARLQPVLVGWGQTLNGQPADPALLIGMATGLRRAGAHGPMRIIGPPPPPRGPDRRWLWAMTGALLLAFLLFALLLWRDPFGWLKVPPAQCVIDPEHLALMNTLREAEGQEARLRQEIARLALDLGNRRAACPPPPAPAPTPPARRAETPPPPSPDLRRAEERGARGGPLQIILAWDNLNDLDLSVRCPNGQVIDFNNRRNCGGELDTDANYRGTPSNTPVENIAFQGQPANGTYRVIVSHAGGSGPRVSPFRVTIRQQGRPDRTIQGQVANMQSNEVTTVNVPP